MDVINEQEVRDVVINPALDKIRNETIPALRDAIFAAENNAIVQLSNVLNGTLLAIQGTMDKAIADLHAEISGLDGWTVELDPPIVIRSLRLKAPEKQHVA